LPSFIGRYRVERELGRGAMGVIYKADDPDIGRTVAIKLVRADLLDGDDRNQFLARFRHEARAAGRCSHPNIVALYDFAVHDGNPFLAMEYVDGVALGIELKRVGRFAPAQAVAIIAQVLDALGAAHALGIVHRDVKPANVLLLPNGQVKVTDFGISRINSSELTQDGTVIGTPAYMSPEQCRGDEVDARSDLFSAGSVLYELLSGTRAFSGRNSTEVTTRLLTSEPRDLTEFVPGLPMSLVNALRRAMAKIKEARYASAQVMADALRSAVRNDASGGDDSANDQTVMIPQRPTVGTPTTSPATASMTRMSATAASSSAGLGSGIFVDDATLDTIERRLARHVGPIARHLVRDAARKVSSIDALYEAVSRNIGQPAERERFIAESRNDPVHRTTSGSATHSVVSPPAVTNSVIATVGGISSAQIERVERALTRALGPIAKLLIKRALPNVASEDALWERLATHIERPADRETFLRQRSVR
jgi:serine/threonine-protein kinase